MATVDHRGGADQAILSSNGVLRLSRRLILAGGLAGATSLSSEAQARQDSVYIVWNVLHANLAVPW